MIDEKEEITLKYIAEQIGVSASTVSRVVNNKSYVSEKTRNVVLDALNHYKYVPNETARSLKTNTTKTIGVVIPDLCETFFGMIIKGIDKVVSPVGYTIIVADTNEDKDKERKHLNTLFRKRIDALVLATVDLFDTNVDNFYKNSIPVIFIDNIPHLDMDVNYVTLNNSKASELVVDHFISRGHRHIAAIVGSDEETTGFERKEGFVSALKANNVDVNNNLILNGDYKEQSGFDCMCNLLKNLNKNPFTAVYVASEMMTYGAIRAIQKYGLSIPEDISIIGFDIHDRQGLFKPKITSIKQPESSIGKEIGEIIIRELNKKETEHDVTLSKINRLIDPYLEIGDSVKNL